MRGIDECGAELLGGLEAVRGILGERAFENAGAPVGQIRADSGDRRWCIGQLLLHHRDRGVRFERQLRGEQAIQHDAHGIQVRTTVHVATENLFRRHVRRRPHHVAALRVVFGAEDARDPEVHDLDGSTIGNHQVRRLQIAMHDSGAMRVGERIENLHAQLCGLRWRQLAETFGQIVEGFAADELHHHQQVVVVAMQLEEGGDALVVQTRERHRFGPEALEHVTFPEVGVQDLDRNFAFERLVHCLVDSAHAATAKAIDDSIFSYCLTKHVWEAHSGPSTRVCGPVARVVNGRWAISILQPKA